MNRYIKIWILAVAALFTACYTDDMSEMVAPTTPDTPTSSIVEVQEDGRLRVSGTLSTLQMNEIEVSTRANSDVENHVYTGWCLVFGEDETERGKAGSKYTENAPLLAKVPMDIGADGTFYMTFTPYEGVVFMRFLVNLTPGVQSRLESAKACFESRDDNLQIVPSDSEVAAQGIATFADYEEQSVGLDGIYNMAGITSPNPTKLSDRFTMSSPGFVLDNISEETLLAAFENKVHLVRVCSKVSVSVEDSDFELSEVRLIQAATRSMLRSTVLAKSEEDGNYGVDDRLPLPENPELIDYQPLAASGTASDPIYFYPKKGGDYNWNEGKVNKDVNPQYVIIKGKAGVYDEEGYYKIALKAKYPLEYYYNKDGSLGEVKVWSNMTYDILRNSNFNIKLLNIDKPGYKTLEDAIDENNPASNISYNISVDCGDGRNEFLISNGTYYVVLNQSRVYVKGHKELEGSVEFTIHPNGENFAPNTYVQGDHGVKVISCNATTATDGEVMIPASKSETHVKVNFKATATGRVRIRIGDILKYIPVEVDSVAISANGGAFSVNSWSKFAYSDITYTSLSDDILKTNGKAKSNAGEYTSRQMSATAYAEEGSGFMQLYLKQASDFNLWDNSEGTEAEALNIVFKSSGEIYSSPKGYTKPDGGIYSYKINGDPNDITITKNSVDIDALFNPKGSIGLGKELEFKVGDIGMNQDVKIEANVEVGLKNSANETKDYKINITQYAVPYSPNDKEVAEGKEYIKTYLKNKTYLLNYYCAWPGGLWNNEPVNGGDKLDPIKIYNCSYTRSEIGVAGQTHGWTWEEVPESIAKSNKYGDAETQKKRVIDAISVDADNDDKDEDWYGTYTFTPKMKTYGTSDTYEQASAFFVLRVKNEIGEVCETRLLLQCTSKK